MREMANGRTLERTEVPSRRKMRRWSFIGPMLSLVLAAFDRDAYVVEGHVETTIDVDVYGATSDLDELDLTGTF
jgi:hypothetical protein